MQYAQQTYRSTQRASVLQLLHFFKTRIQLPSAYRSPAFCQRVEDLIGRLKSECFSGPAIEQAFDLRHRRWMDCSEIRALGKEVADEAVRVLIHAAFPRMIGRRKKDLGA